MPILGVYVGMPAPDFSALNADGENVKFSELRGKLVYLDFWATWCAPCLAAMPRVKKALDTFESDGLVVVLVNMDDKFNKLTDYLEKKKLPGAQLYGGGMKSALAKLYNIEGLPTTFLIGPDGQVLERDLEPTKLRTTIRKHLAKLKSPESQPADSAAN